jgi:hypothetical protein
MISRIAIYTDYALTVLQIISKTSRYYGSVYVALIFEGNDQKCNKLNGVIRTHFQKDTRPAILLTMLNVL